MYYYYSISRTISYAKVFCYHTIILSITPIVICANQRDIFIHPTIHTKYIQFPKKTPLY